MIKNKATYLIFIAVSIALLAAAYFEPPKTGWAYLLIPIASFLVAFRYELEQRRWD